MTSSTHLACTVSTNEALTSVTVSASQTFNTGGYSITIEREDFDSQSNTLMIFVEVRRPAPDVIVTQAITEVSEEASFDIPDGCERILVMDDHLQVLQRIDL